MAMKVNAGWTGEGASFTLDLSTVRRLIKRNGDVLHLDNEAGTLSVETATGKVEQLSMDILNQPAAPRLKDFSKNPSLFGKIMEGLGDMELDMTEELSINDIRVTLAIFDNQSELHQSNLGTIIGQVYSMKKLGIHTVDEFNKHFFELRNKPIGKFCKEILIRWEEIFQI